MYSLDKSNLLHYFCNMIFVKQIFIAYNGTLVPESGRLCSYMSTTTRNNYRFNPCTRQDLFFMNFKFNIFQSKAKHKAFHTSPLFNHENTEKTMNAELFARRLKMARKMAGLSLQGLSDLMQPAVTRQAINRYEKGQSMPNLNTLVALAQALKVEVAFFLRSDEVSLEQVEFRKKSRLSATEENQIRARVTETLERYLQLEEIVGAGTIFGNPLHEAKAESYDEVLVLAQQLRDAWGLGTSPVANITQMLEQQGIKVLLLDASDQFDGLSGLAGSKPVIVANTRLDNTRIRFTILHELAHLLILFPVHEKTAEHLCHSFASSFLIPPAILKQRLGDLRAKIHMHELVALKEEYGISVQALIRQARDTGIINDSYYQSFMIRINANHLRDEKTLGCFPLRETSNRMWFLAMRALSEDLISEQKACELLRCNTVELFNNPLNCQ